MTPRNAKPITWPTYDQISAFCRSHFIQQIGLFGSVPRGDFRPNSDVDVLVEFQAGHIPGLAFWDLEDEVSAMLGRRADLHTPQSLSPYFRDRVIQEVQWLYGESTER